MTSPSHKGARPVGTDAGETAVSFAPPSAPSASSSTLAVPALALASRAANQALSRQVELAYGIGSALHAQSRDLAQAADTAIPPGPWRESVKAIARAQARYADLVVRNALDYGRRFGGLAFACPLADRSR